MFLDVRDEKNLKGRRVFLRTSLDVPLRGARVLVSFRLEKALETIRYLSSRGARTTVAGHIGRDPSVSVSPVFHWFSKRLPISFVPDIVGDAARTKVSALRDGDVLLLENLRQNPGETGNDKKFARDLASFADLYVNDAFSVSHRRHASIVGIPEILPAAIGILFEREYTSLSEARVPPSPSLCVIGGEKFKTKEPLIQKFLDLYSTVFVGGALVNDLLKARGFEVGRSRTSGAIVPPELLLNHRLLMPSDLVVERAGEVFAVSVSEVPPDATIVDIGPKTIGVLEKLVATSRFILWNGPPGQWDKGFSEGTNRLAKAIAESSARSIVGGGDTISVVVAASLQDRFSFLSTAGGAMLEFIAEGTLPGIEALKIAPRPL